MHSIYSRVAGTAALVVWLVAPASAQAPKPIQPDLGRLGDGQGVQVFNRGITVAKEGDRTVARLDSRTGDGGAWLDGVQLGDGVIEVDLRGKDLAQQSFLGIAFHVVDWTTYEAVYFRPFNFKAAGAESRSHGVQYISHPTNTWQKLRAERPGQFEKPVEPAPDPNGWFHARIVLANSKVEVYVNGATTPSLVVDDLGEQKSGGVALWTGNNSDGAFANLTITPAAAGRIAEQMVQDDVLEMYKPQFSLLEFLTPDALIPRVVAALKQGALKSTDRIGPA